MRSRLRSIAARLFGAPGGEYDRQTIAIMKRVLEPASNCIDAGASRGELLAHMVRLAPQGRHLAFEPLPVFCRALAAKFPSVRVYELALSDAAGKSSFQHVVSNPAYSGLRRRAYPKPDEIVEELVVETARLDDLVAPDVPVQFIKLDVEGAEFQVLKGAVHTVRRDRPWIVFEFGLGAADWYGTQPEDMYDLLAGCGLQVSLMSALLADHASLSRAEFADEFRQCRNYYFVAHPPRR